MFSALPDRLRQALGFRLALFYFVLFVTSTLLLAGLTYTLLASTLVQRDHEIIQDLVERYAEVYDARGLDALEQALAADQSAGRHDGLLVRVIAGGRAVAFFRAPADWSARDVSRLDALAGGDALAEVPATRREIVLEVASRRLWDGTIVQVGRSSEERQALLRRFRSLALVLAAAILLAATIGGLVLTRSTLAPLHQLAGTVEHIVATGSIEARVTTHGTDDPIDQLGGLFNRMLDRIGTLVSGMRGALDNVAHDLRTPLARLRSRAESALQREACSAEDREALADCVEQADRVSGMLDALMDIAEAETGTMPLHREPLEIATLVDEVADLYADVAEEKGLRLVAEVAPGLEVAADRTRLRQALANLVDNAVKYTPAGGQVVVSAAAEGNRVSLRVSDTGPGIPEADLPHIWERLYRGDKSRHERGLGLGLSLVRAIARAHGGDVTAESPAGAGATFTLTLPAASTHFPRT